MKFGRMFEKVLAQHLDDVEIIVVGSFAVCAGCSCDAVKPGLDKFLVGRSHACEVQEVIFMFGIDHDAGVLRRQARTRRGYDKKQMVELVLPYFSEVVFGYLLIGIDAVYELLYIDRIVIEGCKCIVKYHLLLGSALIGLYVKRTHGFILLLSERRAIGVIVFLKHRPIVEILEVGVCHGRVICHEFFEKSRVIVFGSRIA